ncbi:unnamed protein product, partial [Discosporangium mesarthrocarpum]
LPEEAWGDGVFCFRGGGRVFRGRAARNSVPEGVVSPPGGMGVGGDVVNRPCGTSRSAPMSIDKAHSHVHMPYTWAQSGTTAALTVLLAGHPPTQLKGMQKQQ